MNVVIVESPTKATTINKYLGSDYKVLASYGHVRDLPPKDGSVRPDEDFAMDWIVTEGSEKNLRAIGQALKGAEALYLATDPDREGEAISWHVLDELQRRRLLNGIEIKRVVFTEITKGAVLEAMAHPRDVDANLVDAYKARRALDYLVGFTLSPVLWRKLPGSRSAGRVQSVALRLICERESEIDAFKPREYWSVNVDLKTAAGEALAARLTRLDGKKLGKFDLADEATALAAKAAVEAAPLSVASLEPKRTRRNPAPPFTTSTLQQEASRKLGFAARHTMQLAQQLYEGVSVRGEQTGLITYMRTDGVHIAGQAIAQSRRLIAADFGAAYVPEKPRAYKARAKNAQEAHEAIRPTDMSRRPAAMRAALNGDQLRLYELVWKRTVASQMASAEIDQMAVEIAPADGKLGLRATGSVIAFDGFLRLYQEGRDDTKASEEAERRLPKVRVGEALALAAVQPNQHFTEPPPRYSEASLVKQLEALGIGRPSTYASIISVLQDRDYVRLDRKRFIPEDRGRIVTTFLENFFRRYVEYGFTAALEDQLDQVSAGRVEWRGVLRDFWTTFNGAVAETQTLRVKEVVDALDAALAPHLFPPTDNGRNLRDYPACDNGRLGLKLGKFGPFIGCSNYPECRHTRQLSASEADAGAQLTNGLKQIGEDSETGLAVSLRKGPYGYYIQLGEGDNGNGNSNGKSKAKSKDKPKRVSLPKTVAPDELDLEQALALLALPREVGLHPETGKKISAGIGRYGPYVRHERTYRSLEADDDVLSVGLNRAVVLLAEAKQRGGGVNVLRELGEHPDEGGPITVQKGRYGPYIKHKRINATLPKEVSADDITLARALELLAAKAAKGGKGAKGTKKKAPQKAKTKAKTKTAASGKKRATRKKTGKVATRAGSSPSVGATASSADDG